MQEFYDLIHRLQPHALIHYKTGITGTEDVLVGERELKSISMHYKGNTVQDKQIRELSDEAWQRNRSKKAEIAVNQPKELGMESGKPLREPGCTLGNARWRFRKQCQPFAQLRAQT